MNQNNLRNLENSIDLKYRSSVLMLDTNGVFSVVFSDTDHKKVKNLESRLRELEYETAIRSEVFCNGYWEPEINVSTDINLAKTNHLSYEKL